MLSADKQHVGVGLDGRPVDERPGVLVQGDGGRRGRHGRGAEARGRPRAPAAYPSRWRSTTTSLKRAHVRPGVDVRLDGLVEDVRADRRVDRRQGHAAGDGGTRPACLARSRSATRSPRGRSPGRRPRRWTLPGGTCRRSTRPTPTARPSAPPPARVVVVTLLVAFRETFARRRGQVRAAADRHLHGVGRGRGSRH